MAEVTVSQDELAELRATVTALSARVQELEGGRVDATPAPPVAAPLRTDRRDALRRMGAVAAGAVTLTMMATRGNEEVQAAEPSRTFSGKPLQIDESTGGQEHIRDPRAQGLGTGTALNIGVVSNLPTGLSDVTFLASPSTTALMDRVFWVDNFSDTFAFVPNARVALLGTVAGIDATTKQKIGVFGGADTGLGVYGRSGGPAAVLGIATANGAAGIQGQADGTNTAGVVGLSVAGTGGVFAGGFANLTLTPATNVGTSVGTHGLGDVIVDKNGVLYYCIAAGNPGTFRTLSGPSAAGTFNLLSSPDRFIDTRNGFGGTSGTQPSNTTRNYLMTGRAGVGGVQIPDSAVAIFGTLTAIAPATALPGSFLTAWGSGSQPTTSNVNYGPGQVIATSFVSALAPSGGHGSLNIFNRSDTDYLVDVVGYFA